MATQASISRATRAPTQPAEDDASKPELRRRRVLAAAAHLFAAQGFAKTRVEEIAVEARVSKGLVYVHFPSKEALLEQVLADAILEWAAEFQEAIRSEQSVAKRIESAVRSWIDYAEHHPIFRTLLAQDPDRLLPPELNHTDRLEAWYLSEMKKLLRSGVVRGELHAALDVDASAKAIWLVFGALHQSIFVRRSPSTPRARRRLVDAAIRMILHGCVAPEPNGDAIEGLAVEPIGECDD